MKKVLLQKPRQVLVVEGEVRAPAPGEALVRLRSGGICGSDLAAFRGTSPLVTYPRVLGHELVVDVVEAPGAEQWIGQRAVVEPMLACGRCRACRHGRYNCCSDLKVMGVHVDGGLQEEMVIGLDRLHKVPEDMPDDVAVLAEPTSIAYHAVLRSEIQVGQTAVVFGAGAIGLLISLLLLKARGCRALVVDIDPDRLELARSVGAIPIQGDPSAIKEQVAQITAGDMADVVFEVTGNVRCTQQTVDLVAHAGRIVLIGWNPGAVELDTVTLMRKEVELVGSRNSRNAFPYVLRLFEDQVIDPTILITHRFRLEETPKALAMLDKGEESPLKILIEAR